VGFRAMLGMRRTIAKVRGPTLQLLVVGDSLRRVGGISSIEKYKLLRLPEIIGPCFPNRTSVR